MNIDSKPTKRLSKEQWRSIIQEQQQSDLNQTAFCESRDLCLATFCNWKKKLNMTTPATPQSTEWLELPVHTTKQSHQLWDIELQLPGNIILRLRQ